MGELMNSKGLRNWGPARIVILFRTSLRRIAGLGKNYESEAKNLKLQVRKLLGRYGKRALAAFYLALEAASFLLDIFEKCKRSVLLAAFLLSAFGFAITMSTHAWTVRRTRYQRLLTVLEKSFSVVQLLVTFIYFILAELGVKNSFNASVFPLVFAIIAAVFTFKYDGQVTHSSGHTSSLVAQLLFINCRITRFINQILLLRTWKQTAACLWPLVQIICCRISRFMTQIRLLRTQKQTAAHLRPQLLVFTSGRFIRQLLTMRMQKQTAACLYWLE